MSLRARLLRLLLRAVARPLLAHSMDPAAARRRFLRAARVIFRAPPLSLILPFTADLPGLWVQNQPRGPGVVLYFHGGAYIMGAPETHAAMLAELMRMSGQQAFLPRYRLSPEHPFPAAFEDALAAWNALIARGYTPDRIILGGDSAGGGLALALLSHLCLTDQPPAGAFVFSPWTDMTFSGDSIRENAAREQMLPAARLDDVRAMVSAGADPADPRLSPLWARFPGAPPVLVHVAETEILRDDSLRLAGPLPGAEIRMAGDLPHVWPIFHNCLPEARDTLDVTAAFIRACLGQSSAGN